MGRNSNALRKSLAAVLSMFSVGGSIAGAAPVGNSIRSARSSVKRSKKQTRVVSKTLDRKSQKQEASDVLTPDVQNKGKEEVPSGRLQKIHSAIDWTANKWNGLSTGKKVVIGLVAGELASAAFTRKGIIENLGSPVASLLDMLREFLLEDTGEQIIDSSNSIAVGPISKAGALRGKYNAQETMEDRISKNFGPFFGIITNLAFYVKDSWVDVIAAFISGFKGEQKEKLGDVTTTGSDESIMINERGTLSSGVPATEFFNYAAWKDKGNWGKKQIQQFVGAITKGVWKRSSLNLWAYRFGKLLKGDKNLSSSSLLDNTTNTGGANQDPAAQNPAATGQTT